MHPHLAQQLRRAGLQPDAPPMDMQKWKSFLQLVEHTYLEADQNWGSLPPDAVSAGNEMDANLAAERDKMQTVIESLGDGLCAFDKDGSVLFMNPAAESAVGKSSGQDAAKILKRFKIHSHWEAGEWLQPEQLLEMMNQGSPLRDTDAQLEKIDGTTMPVSCVINPILRKQHVSGAVVVFHDNSERKRAEKELIAAKEAAEKASSAKSDFLSAMSHELRTPMNAILGYTELLREDLGDPPDGVDEDFVDDLNYYTDHIMQAGAHLMELINEVLDLSRIETGKLAISATKVDLAQTARDCVDEIKPLLEKDALSLDNFLAASDPVYVLADAKRLRQVVANLLSNAIKYNRAGGSVTAQIGQPSRPGVIRLQVRDTGIGMTPQQQTQLFKPFVRMSGRNLSEGAGVGLTVTKQLLELMDGQIGVESEIDAGSTFWIELPSAAQAIETSSSDRKHLLLYIEDSRTNVSLVTKILRARPDIALISAPTGELGIELAHAHRPDVILLDINLPGIDGFEVLERLYSAAETQRIPVLGLSADDTPQALDQARAAGFFRYMIKPLEKQNFLNTVSEALAYVETL